MMAGRWKGPDILLVGWVPYYVDEAALPVGHGFPDALATRLLFQSGNPPPPPDFADYDDFALWIYGPQNPSGTKEYRIAMFLEGVHAEFTATSARIDRTGNSAPMGYTPLRLQLGRTDVLRSLPKLPKYVKGTGPVPSVQQLDFPGHPKIGLRYRAEFKLSRLANLVARIVTGSWAPYAWCEIDYTVTDSGTIEVTATGTVVPSQWLYVDWKRAKVHDMMTAPNAEIDAFIFTSEGCKPAPRTSSLRWSGPAAAW